MPGPVPKLHALPDKTHAYCRAITPPPAFLRGVRALMLASRLCGALSWQLW